MTAPRGWRAHAAPTGEYQMACGHYQKAGVYACVDCNIAPLSSLLHLRDALVEAADLLRRITPTNLAIQHALSRAELVLDEVD